MEGYKGPVCVTGGTGYIASWLIMRLLEQGYSVHATVRSDPERKKDISYLTNLPGASEKLQIFNADLNEPGSFNAAIEGCIGVFHLAHQADFTGKESEEAVVKRDAEATIGILKASVNSKTVKRVVYISSATTVMYRDKDQGITDESTWTDLDFVRSFNIEPKSYVVAKTNSERVAWEFAEQHGLDLVTVIPSLLVGPFICPNLPGSVYTALAMIFGYKDQYSWLINTSLVHVDDVARAHIFLLEYPNAKGRYICSAVEITIDKMSEFLSSRYPEYQIPTDDHSLKEIKGVKLSSLSSKKLLDTGFKFKYSLEDMYDETIQCCKEKGFL